MHKNFKQHISDTAFLVNESRARMPHISQDVYARTWVPREARERVRTLWDDFAANVYPDDDLELSIRNRFFLDRINNFLVRYQDPVFVILGMYFMDVHDRYTRSVHYTDCRLNSKQVTFRLIPS